jgi:hypothetical protein
MSVCGHGLGARSVTVVTEERAVGSPPIIGPRQPLSECFGTHRVVLHISPYYHEDSRFKHLTQTEPLLLLRRILL